MLGREGERVEDPFSSLLLEGLSLKEKTDRLVPVSGSLWTVDGRCD